MCEYVMKYELRQDTPMIHFQGEIPGATPKATPGVTLRASEVKPKLDRFLKEWCNRKQEEENQKAEKENRKAVTVEKPEWRADPAHEAYDYKMRVYVNPGARQYQYPAAVNGNQNRGRHQQQQAPTPFKYDNLPSYFGRLELGRTNLWYKQDRVMLEILCLHESLRNLIEEAIETFFVLHNFGTRQNRGIGGFTLSETTAEAAEKLLVKWFERATPPITVYKMVFPEGTDAVSMLGCGNMFYRILKSGINYQNRGGTEKIYIKSFLTKYFLDRDIGGEKRWMKQRDISPAIGRTWSEPNNLIPIPDENFRFIRGLLGVAGNIRYQNGGGGENISIESNRGKQDPDRLERVPSPIRYKLVKEVLFLIPLIPGHDLLGHGRDIYGELFHFRNNRRTSGLLPIPSQTEFGRNEMNELIKEYIQYIGNGMGFIDGEPASIFECIKRYKARNRREKIELPTPGVWPRTMFSGLENRGPYWIQICQLEE